MRPIFAVLVAVGVLVFSAGLSLASAPPITEGADAEPESFSDITTASLSSPPQLPVPDEGSGPSIAHIQILLDRANFSPGTVDGNWGRNTEVAVYWFQRTRGLVASGIVDEETYEELVDTAGAVIIQPYRVSEEDLAGPFENVPGPLYLRADLDWLAYGSVLEMLAERFHSSEALLEQLNPEVDFLHIEAGELLLVPNVEVVQYDEEAEKVVEEIIVDTEGEFLHALDEDGELLFHFPITLGASYDPDRFERVEITAIAHEPEFYYQPEIHGGGDEREKKTLPPGPRSPVGLVWMNLDADGYGIHGTDSPSTIGYATSLGCVRLTNWDVKFLARHTPEGTMVTFR